MAQNEDDVMESVLQRSLLAKSKRAIIVRSPDGGTEYCCVDCPLKYRDKTEMEKHLSLHNREYRFLCGICGTALKRKEHLDRHTLEHQEVRPHICPDCGKAFKRKEHLNIHRTIHSGEKNHICPLCEKPFYRKDHLQKHLQTHSKMFMEQNIYPLNEHDLLDVKEEILDIKQEVLDDAQPVITGVTGSVFDPEMMLEFLKYTSVVDLYLWLDVYMRGVTVCVPDGAIRDALSHVNQTEIKQQQEDPERPHACLECGKRYKRKDHLKLHSVSHMPKDKICLECGKAFRKEEQLQSHMSVHSKPCLSDSEEPYPTLMEDDDTELSESLLVPRAPPAHEDRPHACPLCRRRFKRKQHLKIHANVHAKQHAPNIWCSVCSEGFFNNSQFESHQCLGEEASERAPAPRVANQENDYPQEDIQILDEPIAVSPVTPAPQRVFVCRFCSKPFKRKDHYRIHLHVHTGVKSFFCPDCGKGFYRKDHLQKHLQVHLKEKPKLLARKTKKELPSLFPIHMLKKDAQVKPEITITAPLNMKLRVPLQMKVPYQVVMSMDNGEQRAVTVDPTRGQMHELLS